MLFVTIEARKEPSSFNLDGLKTWILAGSYNKALDNKKQFLLVFFYVHGRKNTRVEEFKKWK